MMPPSDHSNNTPPPPPDVQVGSGGGRRRTTAPLLLTVRFPTSVDDIRLDIPRPHETTVVALKHLIRSRLAPPDARRRLRLVHNGRLLLPDRAVLASVLRPLPPPPRDDRHNDDDHDPKGKGKAVEGAARQPPPPPRVYVICSIDMPLTDAELADEKRLAETPPPPAATAATTTTTTQESLSLSGFTSPFGTSSSSSRRRQQQYHHHSPRTETGEGDEHTGLGAATTPVVVERGPRGFDRLLAAGLSAAEVNQLRLSFRSLHEARNTADTMPSPDTLRDMEDAWLDNNNDAGAHNNNNNNNTDTAEGGGGGGGFGGGGDEFGLPAVLDSLYTGMLIGFVWPLGAVAWLVRGDEEKIPKRMRMFVYFGVVLSVLVGTIRVIG